MFREKVGSLEEVYSKGYRLEPTEPPVRCYVEEYLKARNITASELAERTGISRQTMHNILNDKYTPGVDLALKISKVLGVPVERLFYLTEDAWISRVKIKGERTLYLDVINLVLLDKEAIDEEIKSDPRTIYDQKTKTMITPEKMEAIINQELEETLKNDEKIKRILAGESVDKRSIPRVIRLALQEEHKIRFIPKYQKLVKRVPC